MFYLKKIDNQDNLNQLKDLIHKKTNPMPSMKSRFTEGFYSKIDDKTINVIIDSGEGISSKGNPIEMHFYGRIITFCDSIILIGFLSPNLGFFAILLLAILLTLFDVETLFITLIFMFLVIFSMRKDYLKLKRFIDNILSQIEQD